jgi:hypothetical protein
VKIAFLCSSLERGRDGVGDYSRRLAACLTRQGHPSTVIALHDPHATAVMPGSQEMDDTPVPVLRLPATMPWRQRVSEARGHLDGFGPDWVSLQFVPFGFHRKGLCFGFGKHLTAMNPAAKWHVMFHELWLGLEAGTSVKHRVWGALQRSIVMDFMSRLQPRVVTTQAEPHRIALRRERIDASILPLFGNIPYSDGDGWQGIVEPLLAKASGKHPGRNGLYLAGVLGRVPPEWSVEKTLETVLPLTTRAGKRLALIFFGKHFLAAGALEIIKLTAGNRAELVFLDERTDREISQILQALDLGIGTTPRQMVQKSGAIAAMLEHGLPVLVVRDDWKLRGADVPDTGLARFYSPKQFAALTALPARNVHATRESGVEQVARRMSTLLEPAGATLAEAARP